MPSSMMENKSVRNKGWVVIGNGIVRSKGAVPDTRRATKLKNKRHCCEIWRGINRFQVGPGSDTPNITTCEY